MTGATKQGMRMAAVEAVVERRAREERREFSWKTVFFGFTRSRRHAHRRDFDSAVLFLDWHHPWLFFLSVGTMLLSCTDAFMTLQLLQRGMIEANPFMAMMLELGVGYFVSSKVALTGFGILVLVYLAKLQFLNRFRTGLFLTIFFSFYACLVCYEFVSLFRIL